VNWLRNGVPPPLSILCMIDKTNHLPFRGFCMIVKTKEIICKINKPLELWLIWNFGDTSLWLVDSVST